jgi:hypothetical protein
MRFIGYGGEPDAQRRACEDCAHLRAYVSLWCGSREASEARGSNLPGVYHCTFWEPMPLLPPPPRHWWQRIFWLDPANDLNLIPVKLEPRGQHQQQPLL